MTTSPIATDFTNPRLKPYWVSVVHLPTGNVFGTFTTQRAAHRWLETFADTDTADWRVAPVLPPRLTPAQERRDHRLQLLFVTGGVLLLIAFVAFAIYLTLTGGWDNVSPPPPI